jgi:hypothetical protein
MNIHRLQANLDWAIVKLDAALTALAGALGRVEAVSGGLLTEGDVWISPGTWGLWAQNLRAQLDGLQPLGERANAAYLVFQQAYQTLAAEGSPDLVAPYGPVWAAVTDTIQRLIDQYERYELAYNFGYYLSTRVPDAL